MCRCFQWTLEMCWDPCSSRCPSVDHRPWRHPRCPPRRHFGKLGGDGAPHQRGGAAGSDRLSGQDPSHVSCQGGSRRPGRVVGQQGGQALVGVERQRRLHASYMGSKVLSQQFSKKIYRLYFILNWLILICIINMENSRSHGMNCRSDYFTTLLFHNNYHWKE